MTAEENVAMQTVIERKIKQSEAAVADYKDMTQPVAPMWQLAASAAWMPLIIKV